MIGVVFAEVISKDPNYIKDRGYAGGVKFNKVHIANYQKKELKNHNYTIIKDPTGRFDIIESISPRTGDCGTAGHFWQANKVKIGTGTTDCNSNRLRLEVSFDKDIRTGKKDKNIWFSYYIYVPDTPDNLVDPLLQPYITQFYGSNHKEYGGQNRGGYGPQFSASIYNGKLTMDGVTLVDKENLKGKWHLIEFNILYSRTNGYVRAYINGELKVNREGFQTSKHSHTHVKYGTYMHPEYGGAGYPEGYKFPGHTIYFAEVSFATERSKLKTSK
tara:strand:+ start:191 stop:1009 length:819 start_codon:yes stop_codon:yes gene_type:complete